MDVLGETREQAEQLMQRMMGIVTPEELPRPDTAAERETREGYYQLHDFVKNLVIKPERRRQMWVRLETFTRWKPSSTS